MKLQKSFKQLLLIAITGLAALDSLATPQSQERLAPYDSPTNTAIFLGPSLGFNAPAADMNSLGGSIAFLFRIPTTRLSLGLESGYWVFQQTDSKLLVSGGTTTVLSERVLTAHTIPILFASQYEFTEGGFVPYFGLGMGLGIITASDGDESAATSKFMVVAKPGFRISSFFVEPKVGMIGDSLAFLPTLGIALRF